MLNSIKRSALICAAVAGLALPAFSQTAVCSSATIPLCSQPVGSNTVQIKPQAVPTTTTVVSAVDAYLVSFTVSNPTGSAIAFTLADRQGTPVAAFAAVSVPANGLVIGVWPVGAYWCPLGFTVVAASVGLTMQGSFRQ